ncbi:MAG: GTPase Era [Abitibacteriaceae bacterium]|nr:GTPase Era [Abditibacteriaceae bacterium]
MKSGFCVLWGRPNVGKSTLLNALLGRKHVIVSPRPQTTRHRITGVLHGDEFQVVFLDTPGIHEPQHKLGEALVRNARGALEDVECVVFVADATDEPHDDDQRAAGLLKNVRVPVLLALNKVDAAAKLAEHRPQFEALRTFDGTFEISAVRGDGVEALKQAIISRLPKGDPYFPPDMLGDRSPEFHISELIREQALLQLREEVPHAIAVGVERMEPRPKGLLFIESLIFVERESQKQIVIGKNGSRIKEIGQKARAEIESLMGRSIYLELRVKVREKWRESDMWIRRMGYEEG